MSLKMSDIVDYVGFPTSMRPDKKAVLGWFGERKVATHYTNKGWLVEEKESFFDKEKDFIINGLKYEIKTHVAFYKYDSYTIEVQQRPKCYSVDRLIFINVPSERYDDLAGKVFIGKPSELVHEDKWIFGKNREMTLYNRRQSALEFLFEITDPFELELMMALTDSKFYNVDKVAA